MKRVLALGLALVMVLMGTVALAEIPVMEIAPEQYGASALTKLIANTEGPARPLGHVAHAQSLIGPEATAAYIIGLKPQWGAVEGGATLNEIIQILYRLGLAGMAEYARVTDVGSLAAGLFLTYFDDMLEGMTYTVTGAWSLYYDGVELFKATLNGKGGKFENIDDPTVIKAIILDVLEIVDADENNPRDDLDLAKLITADGGVTVTLGNGQVTHFDFTMDNPIPPVSQ